MTNPRVPVLDENNEIDAKHLPGSVISRLNALEQAVYGGGGSVQTAKYTFEEGVQGQIPVPGVEGVVSVVGTPYYDSTSACHGALGLRCGGLGASGLVRYTPLNAGSQQWSFFINLITKGASPTNILSFQNAGGGVSGSIKLRSAGSVGIYDTQGEAVAVTDGKISLGRARVDVLSTWVDGQQTISVQSTLTGAMESWTPASPPVSYSFPSDLPDLVAIGKPGGGSDWDFGIDTIRQSTDAVNWIGPENAGPQDQWHTFDAGFDGPMVPGTNDIVGIFGAPQYLESAKKHGTRGVLCTGASPCRWQYTRLSPTGTVFRDLYARIDVAGASPIGVIQFLKAGAVVAQIGYKTAGAVAIWGAVTPAGGNALATTAHNAAKDGVHWNRIAYKVEYESDTDQVLTVRSFYVSAEDGEGSTYDEISATFTAAGAWDGIRIGTDLGWTIAFDDDRVSYSAVDYFLPLNPPATLSADYSQPGFVGPTTADISSHVLGGGTAVRLAYSTTDGGSGVPGGTVLTSDATAVYPTGRQDTKGGVGGFVKHNLTGLSPFTTYFAQLQTTGGTPLGSVFKFTTLPTGSFSGLRWVLVSCQGNSSGDYAPNAGGAPVQWGWKSIATFDPHLGFHEGDYGYWGGNLDASDDVTDILSKYVKQTQNLTSMRDVLKNCAWLQESDDHEVSGNNGDSYNDPVTAVKNLAMPKQFAMFPGADSAVPPRANYGAFMIGSHIQVIMTDGYGMDRTPGAQLDNIAQNMPGHKTYWGDAQTTWFKNAVKADVAVNLIISQKSPLGTPYGPTETVAGADTDKMHAYGSWLDDLILYLGTNLTDAGRPIKTVWLVGDRHANAYVSASNNPRAPGIFSVILGSGISQHGLDIRSGETWDYSYGYDPLKTKPVQQYMRGTLSDNTTTKRVSLTVESWVTKNTVGTDPAGWTCAKDTNWAGVTENYDYV